MTVFDAWSSRSWLFLVSFYQLSRSGHQTKLVSEAMIAAISSPFTFDRDESEIAGDRGKVDKSWYHCMWFCNLIQRLAGWRLPKSVIANPRSLPTEIQSDLSACSSAEAGESESS